MGYISYCVGWHDGSRKFTLRVNRSSGWRFHTVDYDTYETFRAAYDAARARYEEHAKHQRDVYLVSEEVCCRDLRGSWGMSQAQKDEIAAYIHEPQKDKPEPVQEGREEVSKSGPSEQACQTPTSLSDRIKQANARQAQKHRSEPLPAKLPAQER